MAYDYNNIKKQYEWLNDEQKKQFEEMNKNDTSWNYQKFMDQYNKEKNQTPTSNESNFTNQNDKNYQNSTQTPTINKTENQTFWKTEFDENEQLDKTMFNEAPWKITVQEWTAQQTGKPDYQLSSEARLNEMKSNLDQYFKESPRMFNDRETFNKVFEYNTRESEAQRQLLDSYWKRKEDMDKASTYTSWESINTWMKNWEITTDQLNLLKEYNPEAYQKWQQLQEDEIKKRIINDIVPPLLSEISSNITEMMSNLWLDPQDALDIEWVYNDTMDRTWAWKTLEDANNTVNEIKAVTDKKTEIMNRYSQSTWWTASDALQAARMQKALAPYNEQLQGLQYQYQDYANLYQQKLATATQAANVRQAQAQENQRVWNQRLEGLKFSITAINQRTPEQQAQLRLQEQQAQNEMALLQQSRQNDLALYNAYQTAKLNNQLSYELTDLSVKDPAQLKANLNNVLSSYYSQWGDIIQRPQAQVVEDVLAYAQKNGVSVAEALRKNFVEPLQSKQEYKNKIATSYAAPTSTTSAWYNKITINWKDYLTLGWKIIDPKDLWLWWDSTPEDVKPYNLVSTETMESWVDAFIVGKNQGDSYWQCWKFVNDYLQSIWATDANNRYFGNESIVTRSKRCNSQTASKWAVAVFNYGLTSDDWINHGHVAVVTNINSDWSFDVIESNYPSWWKVNKRTVQKNDPALKWFINPSLWYSTSQWYNTQDPYEWVSRYTNSWVAVNSWWWIDSLEEVYTRKWANKTEMEDTLKDYWLTQVEFNEQKKRYMDYVETKEMVDSILDVKARAQKLLDRAEKDENKNKKGWMDQMIAEQWYAGWFTDAFTTDETIKSIQEWKSLYDNLMSNAWFQKYLDMKNNGAQFWIMTDSEWNKVDSSVAPLERAQLDSLFISNLNDMIRWYDEVLTKLWYDFEEWAKPETAEQVDIKENSWIWNNLAITFTDASWKTRYSYDGGKTRY